MKKLIILIAILFAYSGLRSQPFYYTINTSNLKNFTGRYLYVHYEAGGNEFTDSFFLSGKPKIIKNKLSQPLAAEIYCGDRLIKPLNVFLANNELLPSINNSIVINDKSGLQAIFIKLTKNDRVRPAYFPLYGELNEKNDTAGLAKLSNVFDSLRINDITISKEYLNEKNNSLLSLFAFMRYASFSADYAIAEPYFLKLPKWAKESPDGKNILAKIVGAKSVQVNTRAPAFSIKNLLGEEITLSSYKGQYVLVDFWASWCGPCRKKHPALKTIYSEFSSKNFNTVSISLDNKKEDWEEAVKKDMLPWANVSELKGFQGVSAINYGVQAIPANFLIDPNGIIIAKNSTPEEMRILLQKLLKLE